MNSLRKFEISIWTLQDRFITVIESNFYKIRGKTQNANMHLNIDGTQELTFTIPMKYSVNGELIINPIWQNTLNGNIVVNTRKVKVILNKSENIEEIHEFVIDKIVERHENDQLYCDVTCSGLAFYELGKIGYKISLASEDFYADDLAWFYKEKDEHGDLFFPEQPIANLQYWVDKFLTKLPNEDNIELNTNLDSSKWYYTLQMEWPHHFNYGPYSRDKHKIYEDTNDYHYNSTAQITSYKEKARMIDLEESNIYNLTQNIAEVFEVYCRYLYLYDNNYHIRGRIIIFYNTFMVDKDPLSITYQYQTDSITRTIDSTDLVTKMYVKTVDENDDLISIIDVEENPLGEDYILNFDYLYEIGNINDEQYNYIPIYEEKIKNINNRLKPLSEKIADLENRRIDIEARKVTAQDAISLDKERIAQTEALFNALTGNTGVIQIIANNPDSAVLLADIDGTYHVNLSKKGIKVNTIKMYATIDASTTGDSRLKNPITNFLPVYDEFGNIIQLKNIKRFSGSQTNIVYLTYDYSPKLWYDNIKLSWTHRLNKDTQALELASIELDFLDLNLNEAKYEYKTLLENKKIEVKYFEKLMGTAIREGSWQPENYSDTGDSFVSSFYMNNYSSIERGASKYDYFTWDTQLIEEEQDIKYQLGIEGTDTYYKCINLSSIWENIKNNLSELSFLFYDYNLSSSTDDYSNIRNFSIGSQAIVSFIKNNDNDDIFPALLIVGGESFSPDIWTIIKSKCYIGKFEVSISEGTINYDISNKIQITSSMWVNLDNSYVAIYPRIYIESLSLKTSEDQLALAFENKNLTNYEDYYITTRVTDSPIRFYMENGTETYISVSSYVITLKKEALYSILNSSLVPQEKLSLLFTISNADTAIYKDATGILLDSSRPQVSYEFNYNIFNAGNLMMPNTFLRYLVKLNDYELKFRDVKGYVSDISLNLDRPWEDTVEIKNYRTKFEDLFSTILAETQEMKRSEYLIDNVYYAFSANGDLQPATVQKSLLNKNLSFSFNKGKLTIDEKNGIWGISDSGVVAIRGGGIFTASEKDNEGAYIWNTGITPEGINASLITAGQLDTSKIKIYAGDRLRLQMNEEGLFAYKSFFEDFDALYNNNFNSTIRNTIITRMNENGDLDPAQYVKFDENGLFLKAARDAYVLNGDKTDYIQITDVGPDGTLDRVAITWDGLTLRNYHNQVTFYVNPDTGNLFLSGILDASRVGVLTSSNGWFNGNETTSTSLEAYIGTTGSSQALIDLARDLDNNGTLNQKIQTKINTLETSIRGTYTGTMAELETAISSGGTDIATIDARIAAKTTPNVSTDNVFPDSNYKQGDIFINSDNGKQYICTSVSDPTNINDWTEISTSTISFATNSSFNVVAADQNNASIFTVSIDGIEIATGKTLSLEGGTLDLSGGTNVNIASGGSLSLTGADLNITSTGNMLIAGGGNLTIGSQNASDDTTSLKIMNSGEINISSGGELTIASTSNANTSSVILNSSGISITGASIDITSEGSLTLESGSNLDLKATGDIELLSGDTTGIKLSSDTSKGIAITSTKIDIDSNNFKLLSTTNNGTTELTLGNDNLNPYSPPYSFLKISSDGTLKSFNIKTEKMITSKIHNGGLFYEVNRLLSNGNIAPNSTNNASLNIDESWEIEVDIEHGENYIYYPYFYIDASSLDLRINNLYVTSSRTSDEISNGPQGTPGVSGTINGMRFIHGIYVGPAA